MPPEVVPNCGILRQRGSNGLGELTWNLWAWSSQPLSWPGTYTEESVIMKRCRPSGQPRKTAAVAFVSVWLCAWLGGCGTDRAVSGGGGGADQDGAGNRSTEVVIPDEPVGQADDPAPRDPPAPAEPPELSDDPGAGSAAGEWAVGSRYSGSCTVAWPSSPTVSATDIQMTMSCSGLSDKYLVVLVVYPDPDLPVTPSTGAMKVTGVIQAFAESAMMGEFPIVLANSIELP
jgi:hypothetical protein